MDGVDEKLAVALKLRGAVGATFVVAKTDGVNSPSTTVAPLSEIART